jgi:hypothetical protein
MHYHSTAANVIFHRFCFVLFCFALLRATIPIPVEIVASNNLCQWYTIPHTCGLYFVFLRVTCSSVVCRVRLPGCGWGLLYWI